jgi:hypothetical protein
MVLFCNFFVYMFSRQLSSFFFEETGGAGAPTGSKLIKTRGK